VQQRLLIIAHRGYHSGGLPKNSVVALAAANEVADGVEFDVRETRDGVLVLNHDPDGFGLSVARTDYPTLRKVSETAGAPIATLEDAARAIGAGKFVVAEVKVGGIAERVRKVLQPRFADRFRIGSFRFVHIAPVPQEYRWLIVNSPSELESYRSQVCGVACRASAFTFPHDAGFELAAWVAPPDRAPALLHEGARFLVADDPKGVRDALA
jgi:hypothetical protein